MLLDRKNTNTNRFEELQKRGHCALQIYVEWDLVEKWGKI